MQYLHIIPQEKFTESFIKMIEEDFEIENHFFLIYGENSTANIKKRVNIFEIKKNVNSIIFFQKKIYMSDKIIIHGMFSPFIVILLYFQPWILKKVYWAVWGGDLYYHDTRENNWKSHIYEYIRSKVFRQLKGVITHVFGDYELIKKWYKTKAEYYYSCLYPSNLFNEHEFNQSENEDNKVVCIQVGNSADPTNNHFEILNKLAQYKNAEISIICPLSYGDIGYRNEVILLGNKLFGDKFIPITNFMIFDEYLKLLSKIDIGIFNHNRQQAIGNITTLLGLGKKVYIKKNITTWTFLKSHNIKAYDIDSDFQTLLDPVAPFYIEENRKNIATSFSKNKLISDWKKIFEE